MGRIFFSFSLISSSLGLWGLFGGFFSLSVCGFLFKVTNKKFTFGQTQTLKNFSPKNGFTKSGVTETWAMKEIFFQS